MDTGSPVAKRAFANDACLATKGGTDVHPQCSWLFPLGANESDRASRQARRTYGLGAVGTANAMLFLPMALLGARYVNRRTRREMI